jgi:diguanylate cyclase (GGDEF) domain
VLFCNNTSINERTVENLSRFANRLFDFVSSKASDISEFQNHYIILIAVAVSGCAHIAFLLFYWLLGDMPMVAVNTCSVLIYIVAFYFAHKGRIQTAQMIFSIEISLFALAGVIMYGSKLHFSAYPIIILVTNALVFKHKEKNMFAILTASYLLLALLSIYEIFSVPLFVPVNSTAMSLLNIHSVGLSLALEVFIVTQAKKSSERFYDARLSEFKKESHLDPLTALQNRRSAEIYFSQNVSVNKFAPPICVALIDIDRFKQVNDTYGHAFGDIVLVKLSDLFRQHFRSSDLLCRWGGDEFLIVLKDIRLEDAMGLFERLRSSAEKLTIQHDNIAMNFTITIGATQLQIEDIDVAIERCDKNLYVGKERGRNTVCAQ